MYALSINDAPGNARLVAAGVSKSAAEELQAAAVRTNHIDVSKQFLRDGISVFTFKLCQRQDDDGRASGRVVAALPSATPQEATTLAETTTPAHQLMVTRSRLRRANASIHAHP